MAFYRALTVPAMVAALGFVQASHALERGRTPEASPAMGEPATPLRLVRPGEWSERGTAGSSTVAEPAMQPPALPGPRRISPAPQARETLRYGFERASAVPAATAPDDFRYGLSGRTAAAAPLKLSTGHSAARTGWQWSGRLGPLRWMSPLDGEGESKLRFGGRLPGQPRMPGTGHFNVGIHYTFE
jgi:hypothetical protein